MEVKAKVIGVCGKSMYLLAHLGVNSKGYLYPTEHTYLVDSVDVLQQGQYYNMVLSDVPNSDGVYGVRGAIPADVKFS